MRGGFWNLLNSPLSSMLKDAAERCDSPIGNECVCVGSAGPTVNRKRAHTKNQESVREMDPRLYEIEWYRVRLSPHVSILRIEMGAFYVTL